MTTDLNSSNSREFMMDAALTEAIGYMQRSIACPEDVKARIAALRVPADEVTGTRMNTNWRSGNSGGSQRNQGWNNRAGYNWQTRSNQNNSHGHNQNQHQNHTQSMAPRRPYIDRALAPRFGNKSRADVTTEERMMDRIRDKMNKFSALTYDATKSWLSQLLDSGETGFLTDFITLVFEKAAAEEPFCALYARLITELCAGFPHLRVELHRIFDEFIDIFAEAADEPDVGAAEYKAFLALRERRRYRRGYATFVGEIAKLNVLTIDDITRTCNIILTGFASAKVKEDQGMLCEEYADCLTSLVKRCIDLMRPTVKSLLDRVNESMDRKDSPSLTNKARFALMDVIDLFN